MSSITSIENLVNHSFKGLAASIAHTVVIIDPIEFRVKYLNRASNGFVFENVVGKEVFEFMEPEQVPQYKALLQKIVETGQEFSFETSIPDPINLETKIWLDCKLSPIMNEGKLEGILVITENITSDKLKEIEIANKEEKLLAIINNTRDYILSIDAEFKLTEYNSVFGKIIEHGYGKTNLKGTSILDYIDPKRHDHLRSIYKGVFAGEIINDVESFETVLNNVVYNETGFHPIYNFDKAIVGISIFSRDISERVKNELKLKQSLKDRDILLSEIHHRIKNNLALVSSMLQLKEMGLENGEAKDALADSRNRIKSTALVHEMLYRGDRFDAISLKEFVAELFNNLKATDAMELILEGPDYILDLEKAFPFGLLMHELIMNSMKHAFRERGMGKLKLVIVTDSTNLKIEYCECSGKFPESVDFFDTSTTGLMLIHTFIEQLNGEIKLEKREPISYLISIPIA